MDNLVQALRLEVINGRSKSESIAKSYKQLRKDHLDLLNIMRVYKIKIGNAAPLPPVDFSQIPALSQPSKLDDMEIKNLREEKDRWWNETERKSKELADTRIQLQEYKSKFDQLNNQNEAAQFKHSAEATDAERVKSQLSQTQHDMVQLQGKIRERETEINILQEKLAAQQSAAKKSQDNLANKEAQNAQQYAQQVANLQQQLQNSQSEVEELRSRLSEAESSRQAQEQASQQEAEALQARINEAEDALRQTQEQTFLSQAEQDQRTAQVDQLQFQYRAQFTSVIDAVLQDCDVKVAYGLSELENQNDPGNTRATRETLVQLTEKVAAISDEFTGSLIGYLTGQDTQANTIVNATNLAQTVVEVISSAKGVLRLVAGDENEENIVLHTIDAATKLGLSTRAFFEQMQSDQLNGVEQSQWPILVEQCNANLQQFLEPLNQIASILPDATGKDEVEEDIIDLEFQSTAREVQQAAEMLEQILNSRQKPEGDATDFMVSQTILANVKVITDAIVYLVICATHAQNEIVAHARGKLSKKAFYKKNSRWTDGLVSAAKAVALSTKTMVDVANGVVDPNPERDSYSMEHLIVATGEVAASTAQLVAASRAKAIRGSEKHDKLEAAAKAVTDNTKLLVKTVEKVRVQVAEASAAIDYTKMSAHEFKRREMEQQVVILTLEKNLNDARHILSEMRRYAYHHDNDYVVESNPNSELDFETAGEPIHEEGQAQGQDQQQQQKKGKKKRDSYKR